MLDLLKRSYLPIFLASILTGTWLIRILGYFLRIAVGVVSHRKSLRARFGVVQPLKSA